MEAGQLNRSQVWQFRKEFHPKGSMFKGYAVRESYHVIHLYHWHASKFYSCDPQTLYRTSLFRNALNYMERTILKKKL